MSVISKKGAEDLREQAVAEGGYGSTLVNDFEAHLTEFHSLDRVFPDVEIEKLLLKQQEHNIKVMQNPIRTPKGLVRFNPSGASMTVMDLWLKAKRYKEQQVRYPYHVRWTRNSSAVHDAVQRDLLYAEKMLKDPLYRVMKTREGLPAWEDNIMKLVTLEHKGEKFALVGKMDGILQHIPTGKKVGFEFKTKSNTTAQVGNYLMKEPADYHVMQVTAYYLMTGIRDYLIVYEALAKPRWNEGADARNDMRSFFVHVTDEMAEELLDKWAYVAKAVRENKMPEDRELGFFSGYGYLFEEGGVLYEK